MFMSRAVRFTVASLTVALLASASAGAMAQLSPSADPARVQQRFDDKKREPVRTPQVIDTQIPTSKASAQDAKRRLTLKSVAFSGVSVYKKEDLAEIYADMLGKDVSVADLRGMVDRLTQKYRADGYLLSQAILPEQNFRDGTVEVRVVEGYVANVAFQGDTVQANAPERLKSYADKIMADRPLKAATLERYLLLIDDLAGVSARGVVRASATPGASDLIVLMEQKKIEGSFTANNRGTRFVGRNQFSATLAANSLLGLYDRTLVRGITATPTEELRFFDVQHEELVGSDGLKLRGLASYVRSNPGDILKPLDIEGRASFFQVEATYPYIRSRKENLTLRATADARSTDTDILSADFNHDEVRAVRAGFSYDYADKFDGVSLADFQISQGVDAFGASDRGVNRSRIDGEADFTKLNLELSRNQNLPYNFSVLTAFSGQYSFDPLLSPEEFGIGGVAFGTAYDPSEITGDSGAAFKVELRYGQGLGLPYFDSYQLFTYYDVGSVWQRNSPAGVDDKISLASTGFGVRANATEWLSGALEVGFPLTKDVSAEGDDDSRLFFSVTGRF